MDPSSIALIQQTAVDAQNARIPSDLAHRIAAIPEKYEVHDLEPYMPLRERYRGQLRTDSLADFISYVQRRRPTKVETTAETLTPGFIHAQNLAATVFFNLGTPDDPGHADDTAVLKLNPTAAYDAMTTVDGQKLAQKDTIDWLEDWAENIGYIDADDNGIPASAALVAMRKITIKATAETTSSQENFRATRSALEDVEARGAAQLPAYILFTCTPYAGLSARTFKLRVSVLTSTDKPVIVLRVRNLEAEKEAIAHEFKRVLLTDLEGVATLTIGTFTP